MQGWRKCGLHVLIAFAFSMSSTPLLADQLVLRCDSPRKALSFSVLIDPTNRLVLDIGFGSKIETEQFSETVIAASDKSSDIIQNLVIDRVTGQFQLTWGSSSVGDKGGTYQGVCAPSRRLF